MLILFVLNYTATTEFYTLSLHDALPIWSGTAAAPWRCRRSAGCSSRRPTRPRAADPRRASARSARATPRAPGRRARRSEEHTSELQSRQSLVCRLLLEKKNEQYLAANEI